MWTAAILAGGRARRLGGRDKSALRVGADAILERQLAVLRTLTPHILIVGRYGPSPQPRPGDGPAAESDVQIVEDRVPGAGALGGLYTALVEAATDQVLVIACDMPFVSAAFLTELARRGAGVDAAIPRDREGIHPLCASYHRRIAPQLRARIDAGELRIIDALRDIQVRDIGPDDLAPFDRDGRLLINVNTPADYERARDVAASDPPTAYEAYTTHDREP